MADLEAKLKKRLAETIQTRTSEQVCHLSFPQCFPNHGYWINEAIGDDLGGWGSDGVGVRPLYRVLMVISCSSASPLILDFCT
jgi:hypothetical protein